MIISLDNVVASEAWETVSKHSITGNSGDSKSADSSRLEVELPYFPSGEAKRCTLRLRYNITTADYDPWTTDSNSNDDE